MLATVLPCTHLVQLLRRTVVLNVNESLNCIPHWQPCGCIAATLHERRTYLFSHTPA